MGWTDADITLVQTLLERIATALEAPKPFQCIGCSREFTRGVDWAAGKNVPRPGSTADRPKTMGELWMDSLGAERAAATEGAGVTPMHTTGPRCKNTEAFLSGDNTGCDGIDCPACFPEPPSMGPEDFGGSDEGSHYCAQSRFTGHPPFDQPPTGYARNPRHSDQIFDSGETAPSSAEKLPENPNADE